MSHEHAADAMSRRHAGNFLLLPDGRIGCIDYGQVKKLTDGRAPLALQSLFGVARRRCG